MRPSFYSSGENYVDPARIFMHLFSVFVIVLFSGWSIESRALDLSSRGTSLQLDVSACNLEKKLCSLTSA